MDFSNRNVQPQAAAPGAQTTAAGNPSPSNKKVKSSDNGKWGRIATVLMIAAVVILLGAVIALASSSGKEAKAEDSFVDSSKLQAVFLNTGQVYFGNVKSLNSKYFVLSNIYYLQTSGGNANGAAAANANTSVSLVKLGCELHEPLDQMVINRDQVTFWENLGDNGQVAKAVATFEKQNPQGQKCADQSSSSSNESGNSVQSAGNNSNGATTPAAKP